MKKVILSTALCLGFVLAVNAQTPPKPNRTSFSSTNQTDKQNSVKGSLAPATLLLLGLAGSFAGVKIYHNNKKEE